MAAFLVSMTVSLRKITIDQCNWAGNSWVLILAGILCLILLNLNPMVHHGIVAVDKQVAIAGNTIVGISPAFDQTIAWLNTAIGDICVLSCMGLLFVEHSCQGKSLRATVKRLSFWGWVGVLCVITYAGLCLTEHFIKRDIPLLALPQLMNVGKTYGITLRTSATQSFPSGHALAYIFFAIMSWRRYRRMSMLLWTLAIIMVGLRLIIGLHWLSDVVLGSLPLSLLIASVAQETPLRKTYYFIQRFVRFFVIKVFGRYVNLSHIKR